MGTCADTYVVAKGPIVKIVLRHLLGGRPSRYLVLSETRFMKTRLSCILNISENVIARKSGWP